MQKPSKTIKNPSHLPVEVPGHHHFPSPRLSLRGAASPRAREKLIGAPRLGSPDTPKFMKFNACHN